MHGMVLLAGAVSIDCSVTKAEGVGAITNLSEESLLAG
ncbi:MAG: hypothetical protein QOJ53_2055 [Sphingomonadales bacterium]|nr:hypothetical protein [Sphingomonadales bacterium]